MLVLSLQTFMFTVGPLLLFNVLLIRRIKYNAMQHNFDLRHSVILYLAIFSKKIPSSEFMEPR